VPRVLANSPRQCQCDDSEVRIHLAARSRCGLANLNRTGINALLVSLSFAKFVANCLRVMTNFANGTPVISSERRRRPARR